MDEDIYVGPYASTPNDRVIYSDVTFEGCPTCHTPDGSPYCRFCGTKTKRDCAYGKQQPAWRSVRSSVEDRLIPQERLLPGRVCWVGNQIAGVVTGRDLYLPMFQGLEVSRTINDEIDDFHKYYKNELRIVSEVVGPLLMHWGVFKLDL